MKTLSQPITSLNELADYVINSGEKKSIAVAVAEDPNTIGAIAKAVIHGFAEAIMIGNKKEIITRCHELNINPDIFQLIDAPDPQAAINMAVSKVKNEEADILMKGLVGTDKFLRAVLHKEKGLMKPNAVMSYVCALQLPKYPKLLFLTDTAVLPFPGLKEKTAMLTYAVDMAHAFGIQKPKVALIGASEKVSEDFPNTIDYAMLTKMADRGQIKNCVVDGPLDIFLACDKESVAIKGVPTPINGEADVLLFPSLEACNSFYKGLMLFAGGELAGLIQGTEKPVVVMSRSESEASKYYCIALACLMAEKK
ncbi:MAG: phosphate acyltransferase [Bacteroidales bacterium]|nr:phosphate acyltransferase [Bacteroidales bacterium]MDD3009901.1 phosphate acyltransferase [Bacteroidales bacterium]MDD3960401.1 phosphate acyltransferase [Bacteroidales bacterium]MDY0285475.1 phosphate acyltransferase [Bacteroidales bacterium]HPE86662.1 phosphate acyltransferase [Bacteroidales bacterium]